MVAVIPLDVGCVKANSISAQTMYAFVHRAAQAGLVVRMAVVVLVASVPIMPRFALTGAVSDVLLDAMARVVAVMGVVGSAGSVLLAPAAMKNLGNAAVIPFVFTTSVVLMVAVDLAVLVCLVHKFALIKRVIRIHRSPILIFRAPFIHVPKERFV